MGKTFGAIFGGLIAGVLLTIYSTSIVVMAAKVVMACRQPACTGVAFTDGFIYVVTTVGGLVSALVIAQLSVTRPGHSPTIGRFEPETVTGVRNTNIVVSVYLVAWILCGVIALVVGVMAYPAGSSTLSDIGTTWLGLAVSAAYAYFGINPGNGNGRDDENGGDRRLSDNQQSDDLTTVTTVNTKPVGGKPLDPAPGDPAAVSAGSGI